MLRKIILAALVWGMLASVPAEARVQNRSADGGAPSRLEARPNSGQGLVAKQGKKKRKKKGNRVGKKKKQKKNKKARRKI